MAEYIEREALEADLNIRLSALREQNGYYDHYTDGFDECVDRVENFPTADVVPVKHGKWRWKSTIESGEDYYICFCSCCGKECGNYYDEEDDMVYYIRSNYCPNCGAKMNEE